MATKVTVKTKDKDFFPSMDPSDFFNHRSLQRNIFNDIPCSFYLPPSQDPPPRHLLIQHLQSALPLQTGKKHSNSHKNHERQTYSNEEAESNISRVKNKMDDCNWDENFPPVKKMRSERRFENVGVGRMKRQDRNELKEQMEELKERIVSLQKKVWKAFGQKNWPHDGQWRSRNEPKLVGLDCEEDFVANVPKKYIRDSRSVLEETAEESLWLNCAELSKLDLEELTTENGPQFARLLKVELGNAMARVIDRVLTIYTEADVSSPPLPDISVEDEHGLHEINENEATPRQSNEPTPDSSAVQIPSLRPSEIGLVSSSHLFKDPPLSSHALAPPFPHPPHPLASMEPLPMLHYSMQQLFSRTLSHGPALPGKNFHLSREPLAELERTVIHPPIMPLSGILEPALSGSIMDRGSGRRAEMGMRGSGAGIDLYLSAGISFFNVNGQEGLSPCHLKKAKLMFFYTRYPSSNTLKTYFPDVKFSRCVTSQMIKWFSNFREFFYIQMERFARQAVQEALTQEVVPVSRDRRLRVGQDTELYRILNMHYNKSNVYQVPDGFIKISEVALREFYAAIWTGRDSDPCWKKAIYKMICKLDSPVPDAFRLPGCPTTDGRQRRNTQLHFGIWKYGTKARTMEVYLLELVLYVSCFVCGIVTAASITMSQGHFAGHCVLYGLVSYNKTSASIVLQHYSSPSLCYFVSAVAVVMAVVCFSLSLHGLYSFYIEGDFKRERLWRTFTSSACVGFLFFLLITGCVLRNGSHTLCNSVMAVVPNITSCVEAQWKTWTAPIKADKFYNSLHKAETTVWVSFFLWMVIGALGWAQRRWNLNSMSLSNNYGLPAGRILADPGVTAAETEPFFTRRPPLH
ncbi:hypothetical protein WMY93_014229 [Mugilogobius chulae]|uniref:Prospero domain-containing protein n=1 Tax=Mugilogobius chulae TaxID=88201 RepID=A0AAW0P600_9GOBI